MTESLIKSLQRFIPSRCVRLNAPMSDYTTLRVGGPADCLIGAESEEQALAVLSLAKSESIPLLILGNGSNLLVRDAGFRGIALHLGKPFSHVCAKDAHVTAEAGALLPALSRFAAERGLSGLEFASGIPGSVGGASSMNAGAYGGEMSQVVTSLRVMTENGMQTIPSSGLDFGYRHSRIADEGWTVLSAEFTLRPDSQSIIEEKMCELSKRRREKQPLQYPSAGSFFKRPEGYFAGALIEQSGLKGFRIGGAQVSTLHAGFLINLGGAAADDFIKLMRHVQHTVQERFGVDLEPEVRIVGEDI